MHLNDGDDDKESGSHQLDKEATSVINLCKDKEVLLSGTEGNSTMIDYKEYNVSTMQPGDTDRIKRRKNSKI